MSNTIYQGPNAAGHICTLRLPTDTERRAALSQEAPVPLLIQECPTATDWRKMTMTVSTHAEVLAARRPAAVGVQLGATTCKVIATDPRKMVCETPPKDATRTGCTADEANADQACISYPRQFTTITQAR